MGEVIPVSVIIPCYNSSSTLRNTLDSLKEQSYKDFEVIIVNDGSIDETEFIVYEYINNGSLQINYLFQENKGVSAARNNGLRMARGEYICFLDSDDIYHKDFLAILIKSITKYQCDTVYCGYSREINKLFYDEISLNNLDIKELSHEQLLDSFMYRSKNFAFFTFIYKNEIIKKERIFFSEGLKYGEDLEFAWRYLSNCRKGVYLNVNLYGYYNNLDSAMNNINWNMIDALSAIKNVEDYLKIKSNSYYVKFKDYMFSRMLWTVLKDFSLAGEKELFDKLRKEFQTKKKVKRMIFSSDFVIRATTIVYLMNPVIFFIIFKIYGRIRRKLRSRPL
ncbi:glycosyltransferase family 2 protein [Paenibacillus sp. SYP-B4298]|uniref:glycosyltransferase family 2 protein n=1 Tax=Paenibacillus sp. SYP-B4298 TaxID=2996034 RepID=UPI0022DCF5C9|nr:glycosyltransferase family A protein [Paenibacillus sp. SYP-B4298]